MKKIILVILVLLNLTFLATGMVFGEVIATLGEVMKPEFIISDSERLYVAEGTTVYIYSLKDYKLIKKFGKKGEGPKEFIGNVARIVPSAESILINSQGKVSFFTKEGKYLKEIKTTGAMSIPNYFPLKKGFVGSSMTSVETKLYSMISLFDKDLKKGRALSKFPVGSFNKMDVFGMASSVLFYVYKDLIYAMSDTGDLGVFDDMGKRKLSIPLVKKKVKLSSNTEKEMRKLMKKNMPVGIYDRIKDRFVFPEFFPKLMNIIVSNDILYLITYKKENKKYETLIYDLKGKLIKEAFINLKLRDGIRPYPFDIRNEKLIQLIENEETEEWELHENKF